MKRKINLRLTGIAILAILATLLLVVAVFYELFQKQILDDLRTYSYVLKYSTEDRDIGDIIDSNMDSLRITVIEADGTVIYDNYADPAKMNNHSDRPEVIAALKYGEGEAIRKSATMDKNTFYYAVLLDDNTILRVAKEAGSIWSVFFSVFPEIGIIVITLMLVCMWFAHFLTKSIIKPIEEVAENIDKADDVVIYKELVPFVNTIKKQHGDIMKNARMRQDFTANVSHELKTPLAAISGYSELIENGMVTEPDAIRFAGEIHKNSSRLLTLINDIIRLSELDVVEVDVPMEKMNLYTVAQTCVDMLQINAEKHNVTVSLQGSICYIMGNREMMEEVLYNLCDNAIRYNNPGGTVQVSIRRENDQVVLSVKDNGIGISKEHQERIFERFYRVDRSRSKQSGGTGLGLAIVKHIVAKHNAHLELTSEEGKGTEIKIIFR